MVFGTLGLGPDGEPVKMDFNPGGYEQEELNFGADTRHFQPADDMPRETGSHLICTRKHESVYDIPSVLHALVLLRDAGRDQCAIVTFSHDRLSVDDHTAELREQRASATGRGCLLRQWHHLRHL